MIDIEKLLTEAGFERQDFGFYALPCTGIGVDLANPGDDPSEARIAMPKRQLPAILLALQGKVALTAEERKAVQWGAVKAEQCALCVANWADLANALQGLLTRSTTDVVSLGDVEEAIKEDVRSLYDRRGWVLPTQYDIAADFARSIIARLRLTTKQHHQEGEKDG